MCDISRIVVFLGFLNLSTVLSVDYEVSEHGKLPSDSLWWNRF